MTTTLPSTLHGLGLLEESSTQRLLTATVTSCTPDVAVLRVDHPVAGGPTEVVMPRSEFYPDLTWAPGETYVVEQVNNDVRPLVSVTRPSLVVLLVESISPPVLDGHVRVMAVVRQPGVRAKVAVAATIADLDPVAAVVGHGAQRVEQVRTALRGERVDVIVYDADPIEFLKNAFAPAAVDEIRPLTGHSGHAVEVVVPSHQIAAAVGSGGLNATLAGRLTGFHVTVVAQN